MRHTKRFPSLHEFPNQPVRLSLATQRDETDGAFDVSLSSDPNLPQYVVVTEFHFGHPLFSTADN